VGNILDLLVLCRKPDSTITGLDNAVIRFGEDLPRHDVVTHDLRFTREEYEIHQARESVCGKEFDFDFADVAAEEQHLTEEFFGEKNPALDLSKYSASRHTWACSSCERSRRTR
jgi:hypothetical protein